MLVILLSLGVIAGYIISKNGYRDVSRKAESIMSLSVYAIIFTIGLEAGSLVGKVTNALYNLFIDSLLFLTASLVASVIVAITLWRVRLLCS